MALGTTLIFLAALAGATAVVLTVLALLDRSDPGRTWFAVLMAGVALWSVSYAAGLVVHDPATREAIELPIEIGKAIVAPAWLLFAMKYGGYGEYVTRPTVGAVFAIPALTVVLTATNPQHGLMWTNYRIVEVAGLATVDYDPTIWFYLHAVYGFLLIGLGLAVLGEVLLRQGSLYRGQAAALVLGSVVPTVAYLKRIFELEPLPYVDATPLALAFTGVIFMVAFFRLGFMRLVPATQVLGTRAAIDDVGVAVVIVDDEDRLIDLNRAASEAFGVTEEDLGRPLEETLPVDDVADEGFVTVVDDEGRTVFETVARPITDNEGRPVGRTLVFNDVTARETRRQRLEVLNRVLRHNLRNDAAVILGHAQTLAEQADEDTERKMAETISDTADDLVALGEKARALEEAMADGTGTTEIELLALVEEVVDEVGASYPDADIEVSVPAGLSIQVAPRPLRIALENLIENAADHGGDAPHIRVEAEAADEDRVELRVLDDGPGIPEYELAAVEAEEESALTHGSGLGLWLTHWAVRSLGGDLSFQELEPTGTEVTLRL